MRVHRLGLECVVLMSLVLIGCGQSESEPTTNSADRVSVQSLDENRQPSSNVDTTDPADKKDATLPAKNVPTTPGATDVRPPSDLIELPSTFEQTKLAEWQDSWAKCVSLEAHANITPTDEGISTSGSTTHADWDISVTFRIENASSIPLSITGPGTVVLDIYNFDANPVTPKQLGNAEVPPGGKKTLEWKQSLPLRIQSAPFSVSYFYLPFATTGEVVVKGRPETVPAIVVAKLPRKHGSIAGSTTFWPKDRQFLQIKAKSEDKWESKLASSLLTQLFPES